MPLKNFSSTQRAKKPPLGATLNYNKLTARGLIGCWLMNEQRGSVCYDISEVKNHLSLINNATFAVGRTTSGVLTGSQATDDSLSAPNNKDYVAKSFSVAIWMNPTGTSLNPKIFFFGLPITIQTNSLKRIGWSVRSDEGPTSGETGNNAIVLGKFSHIVLTWDNANVKIYVNGLLIQTTAKTGSTLDNSAAKLFIGSNQVGNYITATFDEVRFYKRPLTYEEVFTLYNHPYDDLIFPVKKTFFYHQASGDTVLTLSPAKEAWQAATPIQRTSLQLPATQMAWQASTPIHRSSLQVPPAQMAWQSNALLLGRILTLSPAQMAWQATALPQTRSFTITSAQMAWMAATLLNGSAVTLSISPAQMAWAATTLLQRHGLVIPPTQMAWQAPTPILGRAFTLTPAQMAWQANALVLGRSMGITPAQIAWQATTPLLGRSFLVTPGQMAWQANTLIIPRVIVITATQMGWQAQTLTLTATDIGTTPYQRRAGVIVLPIEEHHTPVFLLLDERADPIFLGFL